MQKRIAIIGAGITGLVCAYVLNLFDPKLQILLIDAGPEPKFGAKKTYLEGHHGATLGHSRDARQFTGTEGLSFQNPIHTKLIYQKAHSKSEGWLSIPEKELTPREKKWRQELMDRYEKHFTVITNPYNKIYTTLNYGGMEAWAFLSRFDKELTRFRLSKDYVYVAFETEEEMQADFDSETAFNPLNSDPKWKISFAKMNILNDKSKKNLKIKNVCRKLLRVPGSAWRIQSMWKHLYRLLSRKPGITFRWNTTISKVNDLPDASIYVWTSGSGHITPDIYTKHGRIQGIGGVWLDIPNPGFRLPFKISAPQPNGYINLTPDGDLLHISGGFGWIGERNFKESRRLLKSVEEHVLKSLSVYLDIPKSTLRKYVSGYCIRPTTPTGLPDVRTVSYGGRNHIMISGAGKAGSTQSSLLALYVARLLKLDIEKKLKVYRKHSSDSGRVIDQGLAFLAKGFEPDTV